MQSSVYVLLDFSLVPDSANYSIKAIQAQSNVYQLSSEVFNFLSNILGYCFEDSGFWPANYHFNL